MSPIDIAYQLLKGEKRENGKWDTRYKYTDDNPAERFFNDKGRDGGPSEGSMAGGANRKVLVGDKTVEKIPHWYGRGESKSSLAMLNALASLGYPIVPEKPITTHNPRYFPVEQEKLDRSNIEAVMPSNIKDRGKEYEKVEQDQGDLGRLIEQSKLGEALGIGDVWENEANIAYDDDGKLMAIDPFVGNELELDRFGNFMGRMASKYKQPNIDNQRHGIRERAQHSKLAQGFRQVNPVQFNSFNQLYNDQEQFKPWDAVEEKLFNDPQSFGEHAPTPKQINQLTGHIDFDDQKYRNVGNALNWMNTPPEQKRLFEFGDTEHSRDYRSMINEVGPQGYDSFPY